MCRYTNFNSHAHVERDLEHGHAKKGGKGNFNSHAHVERDPIIMRLTIGILNFNSHAHVERDRRIKGATMPQGISTHTLTWSVTNF